MKTPELKMDFIYDGKQSRIRVSGQGKTPSVSGPHDEMKQIKANAPVGSSWEALIEYLQEHKDRRARERHDKAAAKKATKRLKQDRTPPRTPPRDRKKVAELRSLGGHRSPDGQGGFRYYDQWAGIREHEGTYTSVAEALDVAQSEKPFLACTPVGWRHHGMTTPPASQAHLPYSEVVDVNAD